jgi:glucose/arabinose dehydrogenase
MRPLLVFVVLMIFVAGCNASPTASQLPSASPTVFVNEATAMPEAVQPTGTQPPASTPTSLPLPAAASFPDPSAYTWSPFVTGLYLPVDIKNAGDGSGRLFIIERPGRIRIVKDGLLFQDPFLDISDRIGSKGSEQGLLGLAFHPQYPTNGFLYVNYTDLNGDTVISRFSVSPDANRADPSSELKMLTIDQPHANHNGGSVVFGPDGDLYLGLGDGGSQGDPNGNGQSLNTLLGKILRIDVDHDIPYSIPPDNPYVSGGGGLPEIWASGLRNPWRFSFDPATGDMYIGDVGQDSWEEIDVVPAGTSGGLNFGWNVYEGNHPYSGSASSAFIFPVAEYSHSEGCSVTGGVISRGVGLPAWNGIYLYGDFCTGYVWGLLKQGGSWKSQRLFETGLGLSTFGVDEAGEIYLADYRSGTIYRLAPK